MLNEFLNKQREIIGDGPDKINWVRLVQHYDAHGDLFRHVDGAYETAINDADTRMVNWPDAMRLLTAWHVISSCGHFEGKNPDYNPPARFASFVSRSNASTNFNFDRKDDYFKENPHPLAGCTYFAAGNANSFLGQNTAINFLKSVTTLADVLKGLSLRVQMGFEYDPLLDVLFSEEITRNLEALRLEASFIWSLEQSFLDRVTGCEGLDTVRDFRFEFRQKFSAFAEKLLGSMPALLASPLFEGLERLDMTNPELEHPVLQGHLFASDVPAGLRHLGLSVTRKDTARRIRAACKGLDSLIIDNHEPVSTDISHLQPMRLQSLAYVSRVVNEDTTYEDRLLRSYVGMRQLELCTRDNIDLVSILDRCPDLEELTLRDLPFRTLKKLNNATCPATLRKLTISDENSGKVSFISWLTDNDSILYGLKCLDLNIPHLRAEDIERIARTVYLSGSSATIVIRNPIHQHFKDAYFNCRHILEMGRIRLIRIDDSNYLN